MRVKTEARRDAIIAAASEVFLEFGFEGASMGEIATRAGGSKATLYGYFASKEDLFIEVVHATAKRHIVPIFSALEDQSLELREALQRFGERTLAVLTLESSIQARRAVISVSGRSDIGVRFFETGPKQGFAAVADFMQRHMEAGTLRRSDPMVAALHLTSLLDSETVAPCLYGLQKQPSRKFLREATQRALETFLAGYAPR